MILPQTTVVTPEWIAAQDVEAWLTVPERAAWQAWPAPKRQAEWLAGRLAAKNLLWRSFGLPPQECRIGSDGIAPIALSHKLLTINLSLTHSDGLGAASWAATETEGTVGVDAQRIRPVHPRLASRVLTPAEQAQVDIFGDARDDPAGILLFWALKEAALKARRCRWLRPLKDIAVTLDQTSGTARIDIAGEPMLTAAYVRQGDWWLARALRPLS